MIPFKFPLRYMGSALVDAGNNHLADLTGAVFSTRHAILKAINNMPPARRLGRILRGQ